jgi:hypothetical protein
MANKKLITKRLNQMDKLKNRMFAGQSPDKDSYAIDILPTPPSSRQPSKVNFSDINMEDIKSEHEEKMGPVLTQVFEKGKNKWLREPNPFEPIYPQKETSVYQVPNDVENAVSNNKEFKDLDDTGYGVYDEQFEGGKFRKTRKSKQNKKNKTKKSKAKKNKTKKRKVINKKK